MNQSDFIVELYGGHRLNLSNLCYQQTPQVITDQGLEMPQFANWIIVLTLFIEISFPIQDVQVVRQR